MKVLFICNQNQNRSKTAEKIFEDRFKTKSAGLYNEKPVSKKEIEWADKIIDILPEKKTDLYFDSISENERKIIVFN